MKVAILYSGGKDSTYAIEYCRKRNWDIKYLLSIKPSRTDCYLFHYATVEMTKETSKLLDMPHINTLNWILHFQSSRKQNSSNTTKTYGMVTKPKEMSDEEFQQKNK